MPQVQKRKAERKARKAAGLGGGSLDGSSVDGDSVDDAGRSGDASLGSRGSGR